jgi:class 3 adenylate cyclase
VDAADFEALGIYDPGAVRSEGRLQVLEYLTGLGATAEELVEYSERLPALAAVLTVRGGPGLSVEDAAERAGVSVEAIRRLLGAAGFAQPVPGATVLTDGLVSVASSLGPVSALFGEEATYQLIRVIGSAMARIADAVVSAFLVGIEPAARRQDPAGLAVARANVEAAGLLPLVPPMLDVLLRQHLLAAQRTAVAEADPVGFETQQLTVVFVDLVGSTELAERLTVRQLGGVLTTFEHLATDAVVEEGGRVIKFIGDEVMFITADPRGACRIALDLTRTLADHPLLPLARAGLASGTVILRDGDAFGPIANLAARVVKLAHPGEVLTTSEMIEKTGWRSEPTGSYHLKGIAGTVELHRLVAL